MSTARNHHKNKWLFDETLTNLSYAIFKIVGHLTWTSTGRMVTNTQCCNVMHHILKRKQNHFGIVFLQMSFNFEHEIAIQKMSLSISLHWLAPLTFSQFLLQSLLLFTNCTLAKRTFALKVIKSFTKLNTCNNQRWPRKKEWCNFLKQMIIFVILK